MSSVCGTIPKVGHMHNWSLRERGERGNGAENIFSKFDEWRKLSASKSSANSKKHKYKGNYIRHIIVKFTEKQR